MTLTPLSVLPPAPSRTDTPSTFNALADGHVASLSTMVTEFNAALVQIPTVVNGIDYNGTSTTSVLIATGSKAFTTQTGKNFQIGQSVRVAYTTTPANYMDGQVTAYDTGTGAITVNVTAVGGAGTFAVWTISLAVAGGSNVTLTGTETLTNKTLTTPVLSGTASGTTAGRLGYAAGVFTGGDGTTQLVLASTVSTQTLTNKTIDFGAGGNVGKVNGNTLAAAAGSATITFPNTSDTLVGRATTDTLTNKTLTSPVVNGGTIDATATALTSGTIAANSVGFRGLPSSGNVSGTLALTDAGQMLIVSTNQTIPANASVAFPIGTVVVLVNNSASTITVAITTDTLRLAGGATTGTRTIAAYGECSLVKITSTVWLASGNVT